MKTRLRIDEGFVTEELFGGSNRIAAWADDTKAAQDAGAGVLGLRRKAVTAAMHGLDQTILVSRPQRFSEPAYMHIYRAFFDKDLCAPHMAEQLCAAVHPFGMAHEKIQQPEFGWPQFDIDVIRPDTVRYGRQLQSAFGYCFNETATTEIYPLALHDALPISASTCVVSTYSSNGSFVRAT